MTTSQERWSLDPAATAIMAAVPRAREDELVWLRAEVALLRAQVERLSHMAGLRMPPPPPNPQP